MKRVMGKFLGLALALMVVIMTVKSSSYAYDAKVAGEATATVSVVEAGSAVGLGGFFGWISKAATKIVSTVVNTRTVTYTDGLPLEYVFDTEIYVIQKGVDTPAFQGVAERSGYVFAGWSPAVRTKVDASMVYTAQWKKLHNVELEIYRNGDTENVYKTVSLPQVVDGDTLDVASIDVNDYYSSEYGFEFSGWFDGSFENDKLADAVTVKADTKLVAMVTDKLLVTYTDGIEDELFADQSELVLYGSKTPSFAGTTERADYQFMGWDPAVSDTVTESVTYAATWEYLQYVNVVLYRNGVAEPFFVTTIDRAINGTEVNVAAIDVNSFYSSEEGFKFEGWVNEVGEAYAESTVVDGATNIVGYVTDYHSVTYTDGADGEVFEAVTTVVLDGDMTPVYTGTTDREGYVFRGWDKEIPETVTEKLVFTADYLEIPALPSVKAKNVANNIVKDVCDSDPEHVAGYTNFTASAKVLSKAPEYNAELRTFTVEVSFTDSNLHFTTPVKRANGNISHDYVTKTITGTLKWDEESSLWVPKEEIVFHTTCRTKPGAPLASSVTSGNQIKFTDITGTAKDWFMAVKSGTYTVGEVQGNRKDGFTVDVTVTLDPNGAYANEFRTKRGSEYVVASELSPSTFTYQLKYTGSTTGTLPSKPSQTQWKYAGPGTRLANECIVYMTKPTTVTYTDGVDGTSFADQTYEVLFGAETPEFVSEETPVREGYTFDGFAPSVSETVDKLDTVYTAKWMPKLPDRLGKNVTTDLFKVVCTTFEAHEPVNYKWYSYPTVISKTPVWNEELGTYTCDIKTGDVQYVMFFEKVYGRVAHKTGTTVYGTLKWDKEQELWVPVDDEPIVINTSCDCKHTPYAPSQTKICSSAFQFKFTDVTKAKADWFVTPIAGTYTVGEVVGDDTNGYTADITINFADDDAYFAKWVAKRGTGYRYDWDKTPKSFTFTVKYTGSLTTNGYRKSSESSWKYAGPNTLLKNALVLYVTTEPLPEATEPEETEPEAKESETTVPETTETPSVNEKPDNSESTEVTPEISTETTPEITKPGVDLGGDLGGDLEIGDSPIIVRPIKGGSTGALDM